MTKQVDAVYENGMLRLLEPLPLAEHQHVTVTVSDSAGGDPLASMIDHDFLDRARKEVAAAKYIPTLEEVQRMTANDPSSWTEAIIAEREDRF
jgi:predicted DNA-binding antitoxin AbrB/MazE fold protein